MSAKYHIYATNDITCTLIARKHTLGGALVFAADLIDDWDDIHVREYHEENDTFQQSLQSAIDPLTITKRTYTIVAKMSKRGVL